MKKQIFLLLLSGLLSGGAFSQTVAEQLQYLHGMRIQGAVSCNVRGLQVTVTPRPGLIAAGGFARVFPEFSIRAASKALPDSSMGHPAFRIDDPQKSGPPRSGDVAFFVQKNNDTMVGLLVQSVGDPWKKITPELLRYLVENDVPDSLLSKLDPPILLRFAGRSIPIGEYCWWTGPSTLQCHDAGEMNWTLHPDSAEAGAQTSFQASITREKKIGKVEKEEDVRLLFEGVPVVARRIVYRIKGVPGLLTKMEGSNRLIIYYVNAPVRGRYMSCILSHWTDDPLGEKGLPSLLGEVMELR